MIKIYIDLIQKNKITIDDVPPFWREKVKEALEA